MPSNDIDYDEGQDRIARANDNLRRVRAIQTFQGLALALTMDGPLEERDIDRIANFLAREAEFSKQWPFDRIWAELERIVADGVVTQQEREHLTRVLALFAAHDHTSQRATEAIFDDDAEVTFEGKTFVVTGVLQFSKRGPFEARIKALGGKIASKSHRRVDYLVVGIQGSESWRTDRYGAKIDDAMQLKKDPLCDLKIVREEVAVEAILLAEAAKR